MDFKNFKTSIEDNGTTTLVAVSKTKPIEMILDLYHQGQRVFGENKVQELIEKKSEMPDDIEWHMIGHLQTNKVKSIIPHATLIHGVDSMKLIMEINKEAIKINKKVNVLLQVFIASEETKFGLDKSELEAIMAVYNEGALPNVEIRGLMGMASFTHDLIKVRNEFKSLKNMFDYTKDMLKINQDIFKEISMGMSGDYQIAIEEGSTMVRIGSLLFGSR